MAGTFFGGTAQGLEQFVIPIQTTNSTSRTQYVGNGATVAYDIVFPYINPVHVNVLLGGIIQPSTHWFFVSPTRIQMYSAPANGLLVEIRRITPQTSLVTFTNGAVLTADDLNMAALQALFLIQEFNDLYGSGLNGALTKVAGYNGPVTVSPAEMVAAVADQVLGSALVTSLNQRINDIDQNAIAILNNALAVDNINSIIDSLVGVGGIGTVIAAETASRIAGDTALASQLTLLGAVNLTGTAFVLDTAHTYVDATTSLATRLSGLDANYAANAAAVVTESTARANGDTSLASSITTLTSTVAGNTSSIATNATTVSGLSAQYTVKVDVNGHVAGFGLASTAVNGATVSDFVVQANKFSIVDPGNGVSSPLVPFSVSGGVVNMANVVIGTAVIGNLAVTTAKINNLAVGTAQIALLGVDTPQLQTFSATEVYLVQAAVNTTSTINSSGMSGSGGYSGYAGQNVTPSANCTVKLTLCGKFSETTSPSCYVRMSSTVAGVTTEIGPKQALTTTLTPYALQWVMSLTAGTTYTLAYGFNPSGTGAPGQITQGDVCMAIEIILR